MSFILDALKKSESERQRQSGPALFEVKVAPPRGRFAIWAMGLGALLAINLVVVGWMALRGTSNRNRAAAQASSVPATTAASDAAPGLPGAPGVPISNARADARASPAAPPTSRSVDNRYGAAPLPPVASSPEGAAAGAPGLPSGAAASEGAVADDSHAAEAGEPAATAEDLAPAVEPQHRASTAGGQVIRETESGLPTYQEAAATPGANLPDLRLDLLVYGPQPDQRFAVINMTKAHEGDSLPIGVQVERITSDGVILSYRGTRFVLQR
jgi:general secretion pathway protein B